MSDVEFDADINNRPSSYSSGPSYSFQQNSGQSGGSGWLARTGIAKNGSVAMIICAVVIIVNLAIIFWSWKSGKGPTPRTNVQIEDAMSGHSANPYRIQ
jgi:hypothetical protein